MPVGIVPTVTSTGADLVAGRLCCRHVSRDDCRRLLPVCRGLVGLKCRIRGRSVSTRSAPLHIQNRSSPFLATPGHRRSSFTQRPTASPFEQDHNEATTVPHPWRRRRDRSRATTFRHRTFKRASRGARPDFGVRIRIRKPTQRRQVVDGLFCDLTSHNWWISRPIGAAGRRGVRAAGCCCAHTRIGVPFQHKTLTRVCRVFNAHYALRPTGRKGLCRASANPVLARSDRRRVALPFGVKAYNLCSVPHESGKRRCRLWRRPDRRPPTNGAVVEKISPRRFRCLAAESDPPDGCGTRSALSHRIEGPCPIQVR